MGDPSPDQSDDQLWGCKDQGLKCDDLRLGKIEHREPQGILRQRGQPRDRSESSLELYRHEGDICEHHRPAYELEAEQEGTAPAPTHNIRAADDQPMKQYKCHWKSPDGELVVVIVKQPLLVVQGGM